MGDDSERLEHKIGGRTRWARGWCGNGAVTRARAITEESEDLGSHDRHWLGDSEN